MWPVSCSVTTNLRCATPQKSEDLNGYYTGSTFASSIWAVNLCVVFTHKERLCLYYRRDGVGQGYRTYGTRAQNDTRKISLVRGINCVPILFYFFCPTSICVGVYTRVGTLIVTTIYLRLIQNRYMFRSFTVLQCSHQHCVQPVASDVEVVGYL